MNESKSNGPPGAAWLAGADRALSPEHPRVAILLAAGHGVRLRSSHSKVLHKIWGVPSVLRVSRAAFTGLESPNQVVVVGVHAEAVVSAFAGRPHTLFTFQEERLGTGHALQLAMEALASSPVGTVYVFPGDMGLIRPEVIRALRHSFENDSADLALITATYQGEPESNYYGRVVRVPDRDETGAPVPELSGHVMAIVEYADILSLSGDLRLSYRGRRFRSSRRALLEIDEFNAGVYAFRAQALRNHIALLTPDNVKHEFYLTQLIPLFNDAGLKVSVSLTQDAADVIAFNTKVVLKEMEELARARIYNRLKNLVTIGDPEDFFIAEEVVDRIERMDKESGPLDITLESGVYLGPGVVLSKGVQIGKNAYLDGSIRIGPNTIIHPAVELTTYPGQTMLIGESCEIFRGNILKGNVILGRRCRLETFVRITGSDDHPTRLGNGVVIKGTSYIYGSLIDPGVLIAYCVLMGKHVTGVRGRDGKPRPVRYVLPPAEGADSVSDLHDARKPTGRHALTAPSRRKRTPSRRKRTPSRRKRPSKRRRST